MILKKVLLVPVPYEAKLEKGMITDKGLILDANEESCYVSNRLDNESGGSQEWWNHEVKPVKFYLVDASDIQDMEMKMGKVDVDATIRISRLKKIIATPDQLAIINRIASDGIDSGDAPSKEKLVTHDINNETIQEILDNGGDCEVEMENKHKNHASGLEPTGHPLMDLSILENYEPKLINGKIIIHL